MLHNFVLFDLVERDVHDLNRFASGCYSHKRSQVRATERGVGRHPFSLDSLLLDRGRHVRERLKEQGKDLSGLEVGQDGYRAALDSSG